MAKYQARPIIVDAYEIVSVGEKDGNGAYPVALSNGENAIANPEMCARMVPQDGDYWVVQPDGYIYLNPKDVFEKKYTPQAAPVEAEGEAQTEEKENAGSGV